MSYQYRKSHCGVKTILRWSYPNNRISYTCTCSPVKIWEDPPQIATKTKWPPSCRKFCVDFKNEKFTKINRVEPFQISHYILWPWEKLLPINSNLYFFRNYEKYIFVYNQYGLYLFPYPIKDYVDGWMANYQTIWRITHRNMQIQGKIFFILSCFTTVFSS